MNEEAWLKEFKAHTEVDRIEFAKINSGLSDIKINQAVALEHHRITNEHLTKLNGQVNKNTEGRFILEGDMKRLYDNFNKVYTEFHETKVEKSKANLFWMERAVYIIIGLSFLFISL